MFRRKNDIRGYTPYGSRSLSEFDRRDEFFNQNGTGIRFFVLLLPQTQISVFKNISSLDRLKTSNIKPEMLDFDVLKEAIHVDNLIQTKFLIYNHQTQRNESFSQICRLFCNINEPVGAFYNGLKIQKDQLALNKTLNSRITLSYPITNIYGRTVNLLSNFFGVKRSNNSRKNNDKLLTTMQKITNIDHIEMIVLLYRAEKIDGWTDDEIKTYEMEVSNYFKNNYTSNVLRVLTISTTYASLEVDRSGKKLMPFLGVGFGFMIVCATITCGCSAIYMSQFTIYKILLAIFACISPFMASGTALGLLFFFGLRYSSILSVTPFLILALGVDDAFLAIHSWQNVCKRFSDTNGKKDSKNAENCIENRLAIVLEEIGPSILISALTNIMADTVGSFTGSPEITLLCIANITAIIVDFFYQITFFIAILVFIVRLEERSVLKKLEKEESISASLTICTINNSVQYLDQENNTKVSQNTEKRSLFSYKLEACVDGYIQFITNKFVAFFTTFLWIIFLAVCFKEILGFEINLTTSKLFAHDSPLLEIEYYRENVVLPSYTVAQIFVNKPGNLSDLQRRAKLDQMVADMEALPSAFGTSEGTMYFLRDFVSFEKMFNAEEFENEESEQIQVIENTATTTYLSKKDKKFYQKSNLSTEHAPWQSNLKSNFTLKTLKSVKKREIAKKYNSKDFNINISSDMKAFLEWPEYSFWKAFVKFHNATNSPSEIVLDSFMITVGFHGDKLKDWYKRAKLLKQWRDIVDNYTVNFNVSVVHDEGLYLDLLENMITDIWQSLVGTLICMAVICALFMNNKFVVIVVVNVIASIMIATLGIMALLNITIDPVVMAAVIISLGFSVDIPTHVSYHFHTAEKLNGNGSWAGNRMFVPERVAKSFASVGFPAIQASICMNVCVMCLLFVPVYMAQIFVRVMCLCATLSAIHSFVLLPALFSCVEIIVSALSIRKLCKK